MLYRGSLHLVLVIWLCMILKKPGHRPGMPEPAGAYALWSGRTKRWQGVGLFSPSWGTCPHYHSHTDWNGAGQFEYSWGFVTVCTQYILFGHQLHNHMNCQLRGFIKSQYTCIGFGAFTLFTLSILFHIYSCPIHSSIPTPFPLSISHPLASLFPFSPLSPSLLYPTSLLARSLPLLLLFPPSLFLPFSLSLSPPPSFSGHSVWESNAEIVRSRRSRRRWDWDTMIMTYTRHHPLYATR